MFWHDGVDADAAGLDRPSDPRLPLRVDVVVIGAGYCGLSAAAELARRGRSVAVLDRDALGWGASSRNGGMVIPELKEGPTSLVRHHGQLGRRLHRDVEAAFDHLESLVEHPVSTLPTAPASESSGARLIRCDYERSGQLYLSFGHRGAESLRRLAAEYRSAGSDARVVTGDELVAEAGSTRFAAGMVVDRTGGLHPARFLAGLVDRARTAGAQLFPHTSVFALDPAPGGIQRVHTARGEVFADDVFVATNADVDDVTPWLRRRVLPMGSFIIATEPIDPALSATVLPTRRMAFTDRNLLWYWRHGPDGRILFGGRKSLRSVTLAEARDHLYASMLEAHPQLAGTRVERVWGGRVAITLDRMPHCGRTERQWYATGCNGTGVALNTWMGHRMAGAICGDPMPPFAELAHPAIPLQRFRRAWLPAVGSALRLQDRLDR